MTSTPDAFHEARYGRLRRLLEDRRNQLLAEIDGLREVATDNGKDVRDIEDEAVVDFVREMSFSLVQMHTAVLRRIEEAMRRLGEGRYGVCSDCGDDIPEARLAAMSFAVLCHGCQTEREAAEHRPGPVRSSFAMRLGAR